MRQCYTKVNVALVFYNRKWGFCMEKNSNRKRKILYIERMLAQTDENHPLTTNEMIEKLAGLGIPAERKSVYSDLEELKSVGMEICYRKSRPTGYYLVSGLVETVKPGKLSGQEESVKSAEPMESGTDETGEQVRTWRHPEGDYVEIHLKCRRQFLDQIRMRYGENCVIVKEDEKQVTVQVPEAPGADFFGWLVAREGNVKLTKPKEASKEYRKLLKKILETYK